MISGTMSGRLITMKAAVWPGQRRVRVVASAAAVATRVETMVAVIGDLQRGEGGVDGSLRCAIAVTYQLRPKPPQRVTERAAVEGEDRPAPGSARRAAPGNRWRWCRSPAGSAGRAPCAAACRGWRRRRADPMPVVQSLLSHGAPAPCRSCCGHRTAGPSARRPSGSGPGPSPRANCARSRTEARSARRSSDACRRPGSAA